MQEIVMGEFNKDKYMELLLHNWLDLKLPMVKKLEQLQQIDQQQVKQYKSDLPALSNLYEYS